MPFHLCQMSEKELLGKRESYFNSRMIKVKKNNSGLIQHAIVLNVQQANNQGIEHQIDLDFQIEFLKQIKITKSASSFHLSNVKGFTLGPFTSRFWVLRKHINSLTMFNLRNKAPFLAWNCITLHQKGCLSDVYLVIKNEEVMTKFLLFLIHQLETIDGNRGTSINLIKYRKKELIRKEGSVLLAAGKKESDIEKRVRHEVARITL